MATILIVDDTPSEAALMTTVARNLGHNVQTVTDGESCIATARTVKPALILLDVVMPNMDGFNTCRKIKKDPELAHTPIIMVTTKSQDSDKFWAERQGANGYVTKPFTPDSLAAAIKTILP
jgi:twitching motility two-component system response regulator PilH